MGEVCRPESTHPATRGCTGPSTENCDFIDGMDFAVQEKPMGRYILTSLQKWRVIVSEWAVDPLGLPDGPWNAKEATRPGVSNHKHPQ
jgi:hypothetical protein